MIDYAKLCIIAGVSTIIFGSGWWLGYSRFLDYKKEVEIAAKTQEAKVESIQKQHELVKKGIQDEYDAKLSLLRQYYSNGVRSSSSNSLPGISTTAAISDATATYNRLAQQCSETTLMLVELQKWLVESTQIK